MRLVSFVSILILYAGLSGCAEHPSYVVCRGETYCTAAMTHEEAVHAAQLKKAWSDETLYVRPGR
jgi:hypothetical protein